MIYSSRLLEHPQLRLPSIPPIFSWEIVTHDNGSSFLVLKSPEGVFASQQLLHPEGGAVEDEYVSRVSRAAMSLRWELDTQLELEAEAISKRELKKGKKKG